ncbi:RhoGAP domain-containing protein [Cavenderia fasciculata]|uniref:RhoGAP domain-containing protein n=1 Tax=Cavenderia fasciculata TaxID=261658 RepID=F4PN41_CACFS|nr:RhoGAP domain-containing protein [Cavenderia fasciculata]EGG23731.1 RhoGAP domain-containing protein [Cavenderia fasciculata]|eukprot:XP_004361582.1 RhoGAP domain-containing protein [Cavenderia fasciculata]
MAQRESRSHKLYKSDPPKSRRKKKARKGLSVCNFVGCSQSSNIDTGTSTNTTPISSPVSSSKSNNQQQGNSSSSKDTKSSSSKKKFHLFHIHSNSSPNLKVYLNNSKDSTTSTGSSPSNSATGSPRVAAVSSNSADAGTTTTPSSSLSMSGQSQVLTSSSSSVDNNSGASSLSMSSGSLPATSSTTTPPSSPRGDFDAAAAAASGLSPGSPQPKQKKKLLAGLRRNKGGSNTNSKLRKEIADLSLKSGLQQQYSNLPFNSTEADNNNNPLSNSQSSPTLGGSSSSVTTTPSSSSKSKKKSKERVNNNHSNSNGRNSQRKSRFIEPINNSTEDYTDIPRTIKLSVEFLFEKATRVPGLFRESANALELQRLKAEMESDKDINLSDYTEAHNVGGLLKLYLRERPQPLFPYELHKKIIDLYESNETKIINEEFCISVRELMMRELSKGQFLILRYLFELLHAVHLNAEHNNMHSYNLAVCIAPSLIHSFDCSCIDVVNRLVEDYEFVFGIEVPVFAPASPRTPSPSTSPSLRRKSRVLSSSPNGSPKLPSRRGSTYSNGSRKSLHEENDGDINQGGGEVSSPTSPHLESIVVPMDDEPIHLSLPKSSPKQPRTSSQQSPIQPRAVKQLIADDEDNSGFSANSEEEEELLISTTKRSSMALKRLSIMSRDIQYSDDSSTNTNEEVDEFEDDNEINSSSSNNNSNGNGTNNLTSSNSSIESYNSKNKVEEEKRKFNVKDMVSNINVTHPNSASILPTYKQPIVRNNSKLGTSHSFSSSSSTKQNFSVPYNNINYNSYNNSSTVSNTGNNSGYRKKVSPIIQRRPVLSASSRSVTSPSLHFNKAPSMTSFSKYSSPKPSGGHGTTTSSSSSTTSHGHVVSSNHDSVANLKSIWEGKDKEKEKSKK